MYVRNRNLFSARKMECPPSRILVQLNKKGESRTDVVVGVKHTVLVTVFVVLKCSHWAGDLYLYGAVPYQEMSHHLVSMFSRNTPKW